LSNKILPRDSAGAARKVDLGDLMQGDAAPPHRVAPHADAEHAREQAYREGVEAGRQAAAAMIERQRAELEALIAGVNEMMQNFEQTLANDVLSISLELAKLIVRQSLRVKPEVVVAVVKEALASLPGLSEQAVLVLNPADAALLRRLADGDSALSAMPWKIVEDAQLERGGCKLETPSTEVDATLETRWRRLIASLGRDDAWIEITV
jgi:flagellar assembly protein FliH